jgi:glycosyltransferase involved in cell wall biosynthesis
MSKPKFVISCPIDTYSGYGSRSRDVVKAIIELDKYDVTILPQRWGSTPKGFIDDNPEWEFLKTHINPNPQLQSKPDIWCQITVPNEFQPVGKYNIGITAGIETTIAPAEWVEGCQRMDLILGSSQHTIDVLRNSKFEKRDKNTQQVVSKIEWTKDGEVLFEGANTDLYRPDNSPCKVDFNIKESFAYLFVGHWMPGNIGEDRKNVGLMIKAFFETFKNKSKAPALILKTSTASTSCMDREELLKRIRSIKSTVKANKLPNVYLLHGDFTDEEMNSIYNHSKIKAMVNLTKGEGFGRPLLEFSLTNKPIITTGWSGHVDFLKPEFTALVGGKLSNVHPSAANDFLLKEAQWFDADHGHVGHFINDFYNNYKEWKVKGKRQGYYSRTKFGFENMKTQMEEYFTKYLSSLPVQVELQMPDLNEIKLPKRKKING